MIQPEPEGSTQGYPLDSVEVLRDYTHFYRLSHSELVDIEKNIRVILFIVKMEILLELTSNKLMVGDLCNSIRIKLVTTGKKWWCDSIRIKLVPDSDTYVEILSWRFFFNWESTMITVRRSSQIRRILKDGGEVKEVQRSFRHSDTERLSRSDEVLKLKNFKKDATLKLSKSSNQEWYEHVGPEVASPQDGKVTRWRRDCAWLMISRCSRSQCQIQVQGTSSIQKSMITTTYSQEKVKSTS
ncbi:hypothetical protein Tco_1337844 [Tanacetum coccineum]